METLQLIRDFADRAHGGQTRRYTGDRYIVHPERVMNAVKQYEARLPVLAAALLHDVLEDTNVPGKEIMDFLLTVMSAEDAAEAMRLVEQLTDIYTKKRYPQWNRRKRKTKEAERLAKASAEAQTIKYADIIDNLPEIMREDPDFADRYLSECRELLKRMDKGHQELREEAMKIIHHTYLRHH
jgi:guanosine-3',5'-bis(diphosphate) 3'-pyrophosphohydrolase